MYKIQLNRLLSTGYKKGSCVITDQNQDEWHAELNVIGSEGYFILSGYWRWIDCLVNDHTTYNDWFLDLEPF